MSNLITQQTIKVKVNQLDGSLVPQNKAPVVLKNTIQQSVNLTSLGNVSEDPASPPLNGATLVYNTTTEKYEVRSLTLSDLANILGTPANGDVLYYDDDLGGYQYGPAPQAIATLGDVDTNGRANGSVLIYDASSNTYVHGSVPTTNANGVVTVINTQSFVLGSSNVTVDSISTFANSTQLGSDPAGSNTELVTAAAVKNYVDELLTATGGGGGGGAINLNGLVDVSTSLLANGNILVFDASINQWVNRSIVGVGDVDVNVAANGNIEISLADTFNVGDGISANVLTANTVEVANISISSLTPDRIVVVGADGSLTDDPKLTWDGSNLAVAANSNISGQVQIANTLTVVGVSTFSNTVGIANTLTVGNTLDVANNLGVGNELSVGRTATFAGNVNVAGILTTTNNAAIGANIAVGGDASITGNVSANAASLTTLVVSSTSRFNDTATTKDIVPDADNTYSLGSAQRRYRDLFVGPGSVYIGDITLSDSSGKFSVTSESNYTNTVTFNTNTVFAANLTLLSAATIVGDVIPTTSVTNDIGSTTNLWNRVYANTINANTGNITGNLVVGGNLTVQGDTTRINVSTVTVEDPIMKLASNNTLADSVDIGFYGNYYNGVAISYTGLVRDASNNGVYVLFDRSRTEPTTTLSYSDQYLRLATLNAYISGGGLFTNATSVFISGSQSVDVTINANTVTMSRPLGVSSGGTGRQSLLDNHILVGNGTSSVDMVTGSNSQMLAIVGGTPTFVSSIDAGTF
jgi:hypothetical protein